MRPSRLALAALLLVAAPSAFAGTIPIKVDGATPTSTVFGRADCEANKSFNFTWDFGQPLQSGFTQTVRVTRNSDCSKDASNTGELIAVGSSTSGAFSVSVSVRQMMFDTSSTGDGGSLLTCDAGVSSANPGQAYFCVLTFNGSNTASDTGSVSVKYALLDPTPPTNLTVVPGDKHLRVSWSQGNTSETISTYDVYAQDTSDGGSFDPNKPAIKGINSTSADLDQTDDGQELRNDVPYSVAARAKDTYGNTSQLSEPVAGTPVAVDDFYEHYRRAGGAANGGGGCGSVPAGAWTVLGLVAVVLLVARRKKGGAALVVLLSLAAGSAQAAYERPPKRWLFAVKIDRYDPQIDTEAALGGATPYRDIFHGRAPLRWQGEIDWQPWHPFGSFLVGVTGGFWQNVGSGVYATTTANHTAGERSSDTALLNIVPLGVVATYRFDWLSERVRWIPVIPYVQAGLSAALWTSYGGNGKVSQPDQDQGGGRGSGWSYGYTTAAGFAVPLDAFTPGISNEGYVDLGLQRTSFFAEYGWTRLDGFKSGKTLILSDRAWRFGLSLEF